MTKSDRRQPTESNPPPQCRLTISIACSTGTLACLVAHIWQIEMTPGSVTVFGTPILPTLLGPPLYVGFLQRGFLQRAIYRAGYTTRVVFMRGDPVNPDNPVMVCMGDEPELNRGFGAVEYVSRTFEATLRNRMGMPAFDHNVITYSTRWNSSVVSGFPLVTHQCTLCRQIASKKCGACASYYCSKECQRKDWKRHKTECVDKRRKQ
jgi:hypothetical protein